MTRSIVDQMVSPAGRHGNRGSLPPDSAGARAFSSQPGWLLPPAPRLPPQLRAPHLRHSRVLPPSREPQYIRAKYVRQPLCQPTRPLARRLSSHAQLEHPAVGSVWWSSRGLQLRMGCASASLANQIAQRGLVGASVPGQNDILPVPNTTSRRTCTDSKLHCRAHLLGIACTRSMTSWRPYDDA